MTDNDRVLHIGEVNVDIRCGLLTAVSDMRCVMPGWLRPLHRFPAVPRL